VVTRIRCQVLEVPDQDQWSSRRGAWPRDLLPWADPYIAGLVRRLEERYDVPGEDSDACDPFAADDAPFHAACDDGWQDDAFMPEPLGTSRNRWRSRVYGGFPLLDDAGPDELRG
jgi:hypothetical protein